MAVGSRAMSAVVNYFSNRVKDEGACDSFIIFHGSVKDPTFSGAHTESDPYQVLADSLIIESIKMRRKKLVDVWNASTKKSRAKKLAYFEAIKDEIDVLTLTLKEYC